MADTQATRRSKASLVQHVLVLSPPPLHRAYSTATFEAKVRQALGRIEERKRQLRAR